MLPRGDLHLCIVLAIAAAPLILAQMAPAITPASAVQGAIPDFSGIWAHPYLTGFEPPASGPRPVLNRSRRRGVGNFGQLVGDYTNPILKPEAAKIVKEHGDLSLAGIGYPTPSNQCWPGGVPFVFWDFLLQMFQQPDKITMIYRHGNEVRRVRLNDSHPTQLTPSWYGDSVGHYEGDTLVIDTVAIKIGPFACTARRTARRCMSSSATGSFLTRRPRTRSSETRRRTNGSAAPSSTTSIAARSYSLRSRSRIRTSLPLPGARPSPTGPRSANGRT